MELSAALFTGLIAAGLAPLVERAARRWSGWVLAAVPLLLGVYFTSRASDVLASGALLSRFAWAPQFAIEFALRLDALALLFVQLICYVGALVFIYAGSYLEDHEHRGRFFAILLLFMTSMLGLVLADNLLLLFVFWELTSFTSYLLIGFSHESEKARSAALQALLITGGGGLALLAGFVLLGQMGGSYEIPALAASAAVVQAHALYAPCALLILVGAFTKSAQFPFHSWLPGAMEAPTPVSAYLHSATMVKAGIYLLARLTPVLGHTSLWQGTVTTVGAVTAVAAAWLALHPHDLKRILAYLTVSALGMLTLLLGVGTQAAIAAGLAYLVSHALYKGTLFLVAGAIDHATGTRDVQRLSGLARPLPLVAVASMLAAFSLAGLPPMLGFVSKEVVYASVLAQPVLAACLVLASMTFVAQSIVIGIRPWWGSPGETPHKPHAVAPGLWLGPTVLALLGLLWGIWPKVGLTALLGAAAEDIVGQPTTVKLPLWHGWNTAVALSLVTLAGGLVLYAAGQRLRQFAARFPRLAGFGPQRWYELALRGMLAVASWQTSLLQSGRLRDYFLIVLVMVAGLPAYVLTVRRDFSWPTGWENILFYEAILYALVLFAAVTATWIQSRLAAIAALGVVGYSVAMLFIVFGAPDVAMTQFIVETLTVILFVLVFYNLPDARGVSRPWVRMRDAVFSLAVGGVITLLVWSASEVQFSPEVARYYLEHSRPLAHGRNVVNVILVDFRGLDTLGEITVLTVAGVGVYALLRLRPPGRPPITAQTASAPPPPMGGPDEPMSSDSAELLGRSPQRPPDSTAPAPSGGTS